MKTLAILRIYATSWWSPLCLGGPLLLLAATSLPHRASDEPLTVAVTAPWLVLACYGLPLRLLSLGASRRLMPGHALAVTRLLAACVAVGCFLGTALAWWLGAPLLAAAVSVLLSCALGWWVLVLCDSGWSMVGVLGLCSVWMFVVVPRCGIHFARVDLAVPLLAIALWSFVPGWRRMARSPHFDDEPAAMGYAVQSTPSPLPAWLSGGGRGQRRMGMQLWSPVALAVISAVWVLLWSGTGYLISRLSGDGTERIMLETYANVAAGWVLIAANGFIVAGTDAGRRQLGLLFRLPGGGRQRIARRLVDRGLASALEVTGAFAVGGGLAWVAMDLILRRPDAGDLVQSLAIVGLAIMVSMATSTLTFWLFTWRLPPWLTWMPAMGWFATVMIGVIGIADGRHRGLAQDQWLMWLAAASMLFVVGAVSRQLAIRRLAVAEPG